MYRSEPDGNESEVKRLVESPSGRRRRENNWCHRLWVWCNCGQYTQAGAHRRDLNDSFSSIDVADPRDLENPKRDKNALQKLKF